MKNRVGMFGVLIALAAIGLGGCNEYKTATATVTTIGQIVTIAQSDLPAICATGAITAAECTQIGQGLTGITALDTQAGTCLTAAGTSAKNAAILACYNAFATGLTSPAELAFFHVKDPKTQAQIEVWVTAVTLAVNTVLDLVGGSSLAMPVLADQPASRRDLHALARRVGVEGYGY
jgi:hypothetical protein